ncbi:Chitin synthase, class 2 [Steccherinum ochraceum]|uniref:Chitin synthase n=1 Tax=Steccherinum ochraceum TaxID=92696 RepID=A0A4R0RS55_9APHY|nr:Chitin synthase, class 2 [Steccherinum ochraceum]
MNLRLPPQAITGRAQPSPPAFASELLASTLSDKHQLDNQDGLIEQGTPQDGSESKYSRSGVAEDRSQPELKSYLTQADIQAQFPRISYFPHVSESTSQLSGSSPDHNELDDPGAASATRRSIYQVELQQGHLVLDLSVPSQIIPQGVRPEEQTKLRYTAATCEPDSFSTSGYTLRQKINDRRTELFIVITMYNEDEVLFIKTMSAVIKNIGNLCLREKWGHDAWQKVVVCIVADGRTKIDQRTQHALAVMGCYQDGVAKDTVAGKDVTAHVFEYTTSFMVSEKGEVAPSPCPIQVIFCLKEQNKKKLNSHRWFFNAFCPVIEPKVCVLLDVGTKPTGNSIYKLWRCFDESPSVGGACGEICVDTGRACSLLFKSPLAASQNFEYKLSNVLDKPFESVFGYISVLPGAFSAYRYEALKNVSDGTGPLASYFKGETMHATRKVPAGLFERNMYLAEDRILCFEIVTKKDKGWVLKYVKDARASTDVPTGVPEFIYQRRRWLNGSLFASIHATIFFFRIWTSGHSKFRKCLLQLEFLYNAINLLFTWTFIANFYLAFYFLVSSATSNPASDAFNFLANGAGHQIFEIVLKVYIGVLFIILVCSLGNRPHGYRLLYSLSIILFGICNMVTLWCAGYTVYMAVPHTTEGWKNISHLLRTNASFRDIVISIAGTYGVYLTGSFLHMDPWHMFTSWLQYLFFLPSYANILMLYAMCNLHDVSWGTKGDHTSPKNIGGATKDPNSQDKVLVKLPDEATHTVEYLWRVSRDELSHDSEKAKEKRDDATKQSDNDRRSRTNVLLAWVGSNVVIILLFTSEAFNRWAQTHVEKNSHTTFNPYLSILLWATAGHSLCRFLGSCIYLVLFFVERRRDIWLRFRKSLRLAGRKARA